MESLPIKGADIKDLIESQLTDNIRSPPTD